MTSIGETLRRARQKRNLDLNQVSRELKISTRFLEAIENEEFDRLPGGVFAKSFVRQYARLLNVDEEEAAAEVQRTIAPPSMPQLTELPPLAASPDPNFAPRVESISSRRLISGSWLPALVLVVAVMLGCSLVYGWWQRQHRTITTVSAAPPNHPAPQNTDASASRAAAPAQSATAPAPTGSENGPPADAKAPEAASSGSGSSEAASSGSAAAGSASEAKPDQLTNPAETKVPEAAPDATLAPSGPVSVVLTASDEPVWVLARTDGKYAFSGTIEPNQTRTVDAKGVVVLRLGNAGGVTITVNGKAIPSVGPKGQVRTVQLTSGGFQIVAPPKPSATPDGL